MKLYGQIALWVYTLLSLTLLASCLPHDPSNEKSRGQPSFIIDYQNDCFLKDGKPFRYISGGLHYFRIPSFYWKDRIQKAKALGLNTIQTYIPWNFHNPEPGVYKFNGEQDLLKFIDVVQEEGMLLILRPGPYVDAEWEYGGFPWFLKNEQKMEMRTSDPTYMRYVQEWFDMLFPRLAMKLYKNGGPIIAFQVENEYGNYYACDKEYLSLLKSIYVKYFGEDTVLFTTDGYTDNYMSCGTTPEIFATIDFGTEITPEEAFAQQRKYQAKGPLVNSEYYTGWLDYWGSPHQRRGADVIAKHLKDILTTNASLNLYMLHGGTNFGFMNGVDIGSKGSRLISPTSYDYDAPLSEAGDTTWKYFKMREVLQQFNANPLPAVPANTSKLVQGALRIPPLKTFVDFKGYLVYWGLHVIESDSPKPMSELGLGYGFVCYTPRIPPKYQNKTVTLVFDEMSDEAIFVVDNVYKFSIGGAVKNYELKIELGVELDILVVNQGRAAYAPKGYHYLQECKGICGDVRFKDSNETLKGWKQYNINDTTIWEENHPNFPAENHIGKTTKGSDLMDRFFEDCENRKEDQFKIQPILPIENNLDRYPSQIKSTQKEYQFVWESFFALQNTTDTYLRMKGFNKGQVYLNMYNLGRFWQEKGPQKTLFVPKNYLQAGLNVLLVIALDDYPTQQLNPPQYPEFEFVVQPDLG